MLWISMLKEGRTRTLLIIRTLYISWIRILRLIVVSMRSMMRRSMAMVRLMIWMLQERWYLL